MERSHKCLLYVANSATVEVNMAGAWHAWLQIYERGPSLSFSPVLTPRQLSRRAWLIHDFHIYSPTPPKLVALVQNFVVWLPAASEEEEKEKALVDFQCKSQTFKKRSENAKESFPHVNSIFTCIYLSVRWRFRPFSQPPSPPPIHKLFIC